MIACHVQTAEVSEVSLLGHTCMRMARRERRRCCSLCCMMRLYSPASITSRSHISPALTTSELSRTPCCADTLVFSNMSKQILPWCLCHQISRKQEVTEVPEETVLADPTGLHLGAGPYMLIYSRQLSEERLREPLVWPSLFTVRWCYRSATGQS